MATTTNELQQSLAQASSTITTALAEQQETALQLQTQFGTVSDTVNSLQKLSQIDPNLLKKYSKVYFLNENYMPAQLSSIPKESLYHDDRPQTILTPVLPFMKDMLKAASSTGVALYVESAYRSFDEQKKVKNGYTVLYGAGTANSFSAEQGYSEHQLGTAADFITTGTNGLLAGFDKTPAYTWMQEHAYKYGFILSYPKGNSYYIYEPWHWRFVGVKLATYLHDNDLDFYTMDQRELDSYLAEFFDRS
jgi:LAS superfamily LD-carboxypeptidase LdcB